MTTMSAETVSVLGNKEVIAISQDPLGIQGKRVLSITTASAEPVSYINNCNVMDSYPQIFKLNNQGQLKTVDGKCLQVTSCTAKNHATVAVQPCGSAFSTCNGLNQQWHYDSFNRVWVSGLDSKYCLSTRDVFVDLQPCSGATQWNSLPGSDMIVAVNNQQCLTFKPQPNIEVWAGPIVGNAVAVILFNRGSKPETITADFPRVGYSAPTAAVRDLWKHQNMGTFTGSYSATVQPHSVVMVTLSPPQ